MSRRSSRGGHDGGRRRRRPKRRRARESGTRSPSTRYGSRRCDRDRCERRKSGRVVGRARARRGRGNRRLGCVVGRNHNSGVMRRQTSGKRCSNWRCRHGYVNENWGAWRSNIGRRGEISKRGRGHRRGHRGRVGTLLRSGRGPLGRVKRSKLCGRRFRGAIRRSLTNRRLNKRVYG